MKKKVKNISKIEIIFEKIIFSSRWILAPIYFILTTILFVFVYDIGKDIWHILYKLNYYNGYKLVLIALTLCDAVLVANLVVVVIISGYENFVSRIDIDSEKGEPTWIKSLSPTGVKMKIAGSIVAISSISLLKQFLEITQISDRELIWNVIIHIVFVFSAMMIAITGILERKIH